MLVVVAPLFVTPVGAVGACVSVVQAAVDAEGVNGSVISTGGDGYIIRYPPLSATQLTNIQADLKNRLGPTNVQQILTVGGTIAGGSTLQGLALALLIGIVSGTYSSIFNAAPLLVVWRRVQPLR